MSFPVEKVRADFPVLTREVNGLPLAYLDSAASAQKPNPVVDAEAEFYRHGYAAVHRGIHTLSAERPSVWKTCARKLPPSSMRNRLKSWSSCAELPKGSTLSLTAGATRRSTRGIILSSTQMEHHANIVPWQMLCERVGAQLRVIPLNLDGTLQLEQLDALLD